MLNRCFLWEFYVLEECHVIQCNQFKELPTYSTGFYVQEGGLGLGYYWGSNVKPAK